ncbi:unnamed protein product [Withania somnifera]
MAIICLRLEAEAKLSLDIHQPFENTGLPCSPLKNFNVQISDEEARRMGDYRDILSLTRVLVHGPESKTDVDAVIERCAGAGHLGEDIVHYSQKWERKSEEDEECRAYLMDMGITALRRYFFLITFRSYLYCSSPAEITFSEWMDARPELGHLCNNLRI